MTETHVKAEVELDGQKKLSTFAHITVMQRHDWHHTFEISLPLADIEGADKTSFNKSQNYVGKSVKISWSDPDDSGETYNQFNGIMTDISISRHSGAGADVILKGYSPTILLADAENTKTFHEKNLSDIVKSIIQENSLQIDANPSPDVLFGFQVQYQETNYAFISRLAEETGQWFYYDGKDFHFGKIKSEGSKIELKLGNDISHFDFGMHTKPLKFTDIYYDYFNNDVIKYKSSSFNVTGLDSIGTDMQSKSYNLFKNDYQGISRPFVKTQSDLKVFTTARKSATAAGLVTISGVSFNPKLCIGKKIDVVTIDSKDNKTSYGSYIVINITHFTDGLGVYQNKFEAISVNLTLPPANPNVRYPTCEAQPAVVVKNDDSQGYGRVKVKFYWQEDEEPTPWIRVLNQYAGKDKGFQFIPEVDDSVMVAFEQNNPSRPYVIGALYHGKANHSDRKDGNGKNYIKTIRTVSGNEIKLYDEGGKEEILIQNKDGQNQISLSLANDGMITIKSKNKMQLQAKEILIEGEDKVTIKSKEIDIQAQQTLAIESQQDCSLKGMSTKIQTTADMSISAGSTGELKATAGLTVDGGPQTSVKSSAMLELNGGAMATLKGGMVMIN